MAALKVYNEKGWNDTAMFVSYINRLWRILDVRHSFEGIVIVCASLAVFFLYLPWKCNYV